jgi:hypothetical protein
MKLRFICAQPATKYYTWQVEVLIKNFMSMGINPNMMDIVCAKQNGEIPEEWSMLCNKYNMVRFFFYDDKRATKHYISSIRPNILKQHFETHHYLKDEAIFYHDCDIVFTKPIDWEQYLQDDKWYGSDCRWYIGHNYIASKGHNIFEDMCRIVGINPNLVKDNELNSIGAQYLMKGIDSQFWHNVERDCESLFQKITDKNSIIKHADPDYHEVQIWCADMWAVLWNGWKLGYESICAEGLQFSWATSHVSEWDKYSIMHNAGVTNNNSDLFNKGKYQNTIPPKDIKVNPDACSYKYYELVKQL